MPHNLLQKPSEIEPNDSKPFLNDKLNREVCADNLQILIESIFQPFTLSIDSSWGTGKTTFIKMFMQKLKNDGYSVLYFNAWENDFSDDPFVSFIGDIGSQINSGEFKVSPKSKTSWKKVRNKSIGIIKTIAPTAIRVASGGIVGNKDVTDFLAKFAEKTLDEYEKKKNDINRFREELEKFVSSVILNNPKKTPIIFFIDELDRCRPSYAIELLENIKHLFNVKLTAFILAIDRQQLAHSVKSLYGVGMDADGYLNRFIDYNYQLPYPSLKEFFNYLWDQFKLEEELKKAGGQPGGEKRKFGESFCELFEILKFSLRTMSQCFIEINIVMRIHISKREYYYPEYLSFLVCLKKIKPDLYSQFNRREIDFQIILEFVKSTKNGQSFFQSWSGKQIKSFLICAFNDVGQIREIIKKALADRNSGTFNEFSDLSDHLDEMIRNRQADVHDRLVKSLSITEKIKFH